MKIPLPLVQVPDTLPDNWRELADVVYEGLGYTAYNVWGVMPLCYVVVFENEETIYAHRREIELAIFADTGHKVTVRPF